jgi:thiamine-monophosphate kinase
MTSMTRSVSDLGEWGLIDLVTERIGPPPEGEIWSGDDAAVVQSPGEKLVLTTDVMVENVDFDFTYSPPQDVGWKAMAVNVSDIAAMGGVPRHAVASLSLRPDTSVVDIESLLDGFLGAAEEWGVFVVGGDVSTAGEISISVTLIGSLPGGRPIRRSGALGGDAICVTGELGGAAGGLIALKNKPSGGLRAGWDVGPEHDGPLDKLAARQLRPQARLAESRALLAVDPTAMIDVSDGLVADLEHILDAGGLGCRLEPEWIPVDENLTVLQTLVEDLDPMELALTGGEDFELIVTLDPASVAEARLAMEHMGTSLTRIGTVMTSGERLLGEEPLRVWKEKAWEHLRNR